MSSEGTNARKARSLRRRSVALETTLADLRSWLFTPGDTRCRFATEPFILLFGMMAIPIDGSKACSVRGIADCEWIVENRCEHKTLVAAGARKSF